MLLAVEAGLVAYVVTHVHGINSVAGMVRNNGAAFYAALFLPLSPVLFSRGLLKQRWLIRNGEVAIATVISTSNSPGRTNRNDDIRTVEYEFRDGTNATLSGSSVDPTFSLREGSAMLVFYDADDPTNQIAECVAYYEVTAPKLEPVWINKIG